MSLYCRCCCACMVVYPLCILCVKTSCKTSQSVWEHPPSTLEQTVCGRLHLLIKVSYSNNNPALLYFKCVLFHPSSASSAQWHTIFTDCVVWFISSVPTLFGSGFVVALHHWERRKEPAAKMERRSFYAQPFLCSNVRLSCM